MKREVLPTLPPSDDELDALLGDFFKAQMPDPWPAFKKPTLRLATPLPRPERRHPWQVLRTRLALAASIGLLALAAWMLSDKLTGPRATGDTVFDTITDPRAEPKHDPLRGVKPPKVKSQENFFQEKGGTGIKLTVEEDPSGK